MGGVFPIRQVDGQVAYNPTLRDNVPPGNLAFGEGCLAVADRTHLKVFVPPAYLLGEREEQSRRESWSAGALLGLAREELTRLRAPGTASAEPGKKAKDPGLSRDTRQIPEFAWSLPGRRSWAQDLSAGERVVRGTSPDGSFAPDLLLTAGPCEFPSLRANGWTTIFLRKTHSPEPSWRRPVPVTPHWQGEHADRVVLGGPQGIVCLSSDRGEPCWLAGDLDRHAAGPWGGFHLDSGRLYCMQGQRRLLAYDVETGRLLWEKWAPGGMLGDAVPDGRFLPGYRVMEKTLLVQLGTGRRWLLDAATGVCLHEAPADREPWPVLSWSSGFSRSSPQDRLKPELQLNPAPIFIREKEKLVQLDANTGEEGWNWPLPGKALRTGEPIQVLVSPDSVLVLTPTNLGLQLQRLDPRTGSPHWNKPPYLSAERLDLSGCSVDERAVYLVREQTLLALSLQDGRVLWEKPLSGPKGTWRTLLLHGSRQKEPGQTSGDTLLVYPDQVPAQSWELCWLGGSVQWIVGGVPEARPTQGCPIHCLEPASGQLIQRLNLPACLPRMLGPNRQAGLEELAVQPSLRVREVLVPSGLVVRLGAKGLVVALGGQVWGYEGLKDQPPTHR